MIIEFRLPETQESVRVVRKTDCVAVSVDRGRSFVFDVTGRLLHAVQNGARFSRGLDNHLLAGPDGKSGPGPSVDEIYRELERVLAAAPPAARQALYPASRCDSGRLNEEARRFKQMYGCAPELPPDEARAVYLQATIGCATNQCTFCTLYRGRCYRERSVGDFAQHLRDVLDLLGTDIVRRRSIFLGDANALAVPTDDLSVMLRLARAALPGRPVSCFADATVHISKGVPDLRELRESGLRRVIVGLESADPCVRRILNKQGTVHDAAQTLRIARAAGLNVGVTVLIGAGGEACLAKHRLATLAFLREQPLGEGDVVYLAPLRAGPKAARDAHGTAADADAHMQERVMRYWVRRHFGRDVRIMSYDIRRSVY